MTFTVLIANLLLGMTRCLWVILYILKFFVLCLGLMSVHLAQ